MDMASGVKTGVKHSVYYSIYLFAGVSAFSLTTSTSSGFAPPSIKALSYSVNARFTLSDSCSFAPSFLLDYWS